MATDIPSTGALTLALIASSAIIFGIAVLAEELQERALRRRRRPADRAKVAAFLASRRTSA